MFSNRTISQALVKVESGLGFEVVTEIYIPLWTVQSMSFHRDLNTVD